MSDFFREVDEDYRRERFIQIWTKYQFWFIALAVLIVAGAAGWRIYQHVHNKSAEAAGAKYEAALQLSSEGKSAEAQAAFDALAKTAPMGYATLARLRAGDEIAAHDPAAAIKAYARLGADRNYSLAFRNVAQAREAILSVDALDPKQFEQKFGRLAAPTFTYSNIVRELLALSALKRHDFDDAGRWLDMIIGDPTASQSVRQRAEGFLGLVQAGKAPPERNRAKKGPANEKTGIESGKAPTGAAAPQPAASAKTPAEQPPVAETTPEKAPANAAAPQPAASAKTPADKPSAEETPPK